MAEFSDSPAISTEDHVRLYTSIEQAYVEDRWADVLEQGHTLLASLEADDVELRQRLQLLMAHTCLYGYGDRDSAEDLYRAVLTSKAEPSLRQIADQGLQQCDRPLQREPREAVFDPPMATAIPTTEPKLDPELLPRPVAAPLHDGNAPSLHDSLEALGMAEGESNRPRASSGSGETVSPVTPWLTTEPSSPAPQASPEPSPETGLSLREFATVPNGSAAPAAAESSTLIPDVIEEPELIEVHQADPSLAEEFELTETGSLTGALAEMPAMAMPVGGETVMEDAGFVEDPELLAGLLKVVIR
jgi:hypothetical protein